MVGIAANELSRHVMVAGNRPTKGAYMAKKSIANYWENETPIGGENGVLIGSTHVISYPKAGVLVLAKSKGGQPHKKTAIYLSAMEKDDRDRLQRVINTAFSTADSPSLESQLAESSNALMGEGTTDDAALQDAEASFIPDTDSILTDEHDGRSDPEA